MFKILRFTIYRYYLLNDDYNEKLKSDFNTISL